MGCRWTPAVPVRIDLFTAIEAVNGGNDDPAQSGIPFWQHQLDRGYRLTAIGGSDNHDPTLPPDALNAIGHPTTVVYAVELSAPGILAGIRSGRVFVDVTGSRDRLLDISAQTQTSSAVMGGVLMVRAGEEIDVEAQVHGCGGCTADLVEQGQDSGRREQVVHGNRASLHWTLDKGPTHRWFFVEVRDSSAQILLLGNPIYVNWSPPQG